MAAKLSLPNLSEKEILQARSLIVLVDFTNFKTHIDHHRIWSSVYCNATKHFKKEFPKDLIIYLEKKHQGNIHKTKQQFIASLEILHELKKLNIPAIEIKGNSLAKKLFKDISKRYSNDIDIIIPKKKLSQACEQLSKMRYNCEIFSKLSSTKQSSYFKACKDITFKKANITLELHVRLCNDKSKLSDKMAEHLFSEGNKENISYLELIYLSRHGAHTLFHRLKWLVDIALYLNLLEKKDTNKYAEESINLAEKLGETRSLVMSWLLAHLIFGIKLPDLIKEYYLQSKLLQVLVKLSINNLNHPENVFSIKNKLEMFFCDLNLTNDFRKKTLVFFIKLRPTNLDYAAFPNIPDAMNFIYYLLRPIRVIHQQFINFKKT